MKNSRRVVRGMAVTAGVVLMGVAGMFALSLTASRPRNLGVRDGRLADPPATPNCVSTQAEDHHSWIAPIAFQQSPEAAWATLRQVIDELPRTTVVTETDNYLHAEVRTPVFRFTDDVEFLLEPESRRIHFRSASRVGRSDLGANRNRMEQIRRRFQALQ